MIESVDFEKLTFREVVKGYGQPRKECRVGDIVLVDTQTNRGATYVDSYRIKDIDLKKQMSGVTPICRHHHNDEVTPIPKVEQESELPLADIQRDVEQSLRKGQDLMNIINEPD